MKSISKKLAGIALGAVLALGLMGCPGDPEDQPHGHYVSDEWYSDGTGHWHMYFCQLNPDVDRIDEGPHVYEVWTVERLPTEESEGLESSSCSVCGWFTGRTIDKIAHVHSKGEYHSEVASTCTTKGNVEYYDCTKEGCEIKLDEAGNPIDDVEKGYTFHEPGTWHEPVAGTCVQMATVGYYDCLNCSAYLDEYGDEIYSIWGGYGFHALGTKHEAVTGTCVAKGTREYYDCANYGCSKKFDKDGNVLSSLDGEYGPHTLGTKHAAITGTCVAKGKREYYDCANRDCSVKFDKDMNVLSSLDGEYGPHALGTKHEAVPGTCTEYGTIEYYDCSNYGCSKKIDKDLNVVNSTMGSKDPTRHSPTAGIIGVIYCRYCFALEANPEGFVLIPAGSFSMGIKEEVSVEGIADNKPARNVTISNAFYMCDHEVT